jgi:tryptophanase
MTNLIKKFTTLFKHDRDVYVNAARVNESYKKVAVRPTQASLINTLKLDYIIVVRQGKNAETILNIDIITVRGNETHGSIFMTPDYFQATESELALLEATHRPGYSDTIVKYHLIFDNLITDLRAATTIEAFD